MSKYTDQAKLDLKEKRTFIDGYVWEMDYENNHRLANVRSGESTDWLVYNAPAVLHNMLVVTPFFANILPSRQLLTWQQLTRL